MLSFGALAFSAVLGLSAALLLDMDDFIPFFILWCAAALLLAAKLDGAATTEANRHARETSGKKLRPLRDARRGLVHCRQ